ncbi:MAG: FKBP-type peptidyl-prolyl cis-trans isomerase [Candidatus Paceibacterota bacterium]
MGSVWYFSDHSVQSGNSRVTESGLKIEDIIVGTGASAVAGKKVFVHYIGTLTDGTKFDASRDRGDVPFSFTLGEGEVIKGWDEGVSGMKVGGKRNLTIPPELGYGERNVGVIPPGSTLIFEVELLKAE